MSEALRIHQQLSSFFNEHRVEKVWFASGADESPVDAYQVNFARLCLVVSGEYEFEISAKDEVKQVVASVGEAVYIPSQCWDKPKWNQPGQTLTLLFAPRQVGLSLNRCKDSAQLIPEAKSMIPGGLNREARLMEQALTEMAFFSPMNPAAPALTEALIRHCQHQHFKQESTDISRTQSRWESICLYLQRNYGKNITRDNVAREFAITPNHLSRLFRQEGKMGFNDYLTYVRIAQVKLLLTRYQFNLDEIAERTGFTGGDYLGRVFRKNTGMTPGEYRARYSKREAV